MSFDSLLPHYKDKLNLAMMLGKFEHIGMSGLVRYNIASMLLDPHVTKGLLEMCRRASKDVVQAVRSGHVTGDVVDKIASRAHGVTFNNKGQPREVALEYAHDLLQDMQHSLVHVRSWKVAYNTRSNSPFPRHFIHMQHIVRMFVNFRGIHHCAFELPDMSMLTTMEEFTLRGNHVVGDFPQWIHCWKNLKLFDISNTRIRGTVPPTIGRCTLLHTFNINKTLVSDDMPKELALCTAMADLHIATNHKTARLRSVDQFWRLFPALRNLSVNVAPNAQLIDCSFLDETSEHAPGEEDHIVDLYGITDPDVVRLAPESRFTKSVYTDHVHIQTYRIHVTFEVYHLSIAFNMPGLADYTYM